MTLAPGFQLPEHLAARRSAMRREWAVQVIAASLALAALVAAGLFIRPINAIRQERQLVIDPESMKGLPPGLALLGKLSTLRALAIDWASIRAERLKEEGKTYEALQLHETVCALAPRFPNVWINAAWNMAYNISVSQYSPEARWQWVQNGIRILRDEGIRYNPNAVALYKELAWIYWHKIGDFLDDEHLSYKKALAVQMESVLGAPPVVLTDEEYFAWFRKIVDAPRDLDEFIESDTEVAQLAAILRAVNLAPDESLLAFVARRIRPELRTSELLKEGAEVDPLLVRQLEVVTDPERSEQLEQLLAAVRSKVLRDRYKFDLDAMFGLMRRYGPLDWRNAFSHSLYWSDRGDELSRGHENLSINDQMNNARFVFYSLQNLVVKGRITLWPAFGDPFSSYIELTPDTRYIPYVYDAYLRLGKDHFGDDPRFKEGTPGPIYMPGFVSNMSSWIQLLYLEGGDRNRKLAESFYAWLRENNPHPDGSTQDQYLKTLDEYVMGDILDRLQTYKAASAFIRSLIQRALKHLALGQTGLGVRALRRAKMCYDYWQSDTKVDINERRKLQPLATMVRDEIEAYMKHPRVAPLYKAMLWKHLPLRQRQDTYDQLSAYFERLCEALQPPWDVARAFPQPPGMEEYRRQSPDYRGKPRRDVEQGERYKQ